ncbi:hypothetical protein C2W62_07150 [Candidatus Entotheonella serta]|nr:hypothetical protein C2W62_07150 [Candidatus Entotheonella serta]
MKPEDYPACWSRIELSQVDIDIRRCSRCSTLWQLIWLPRDMILEAEPLPEQILELLPGETPLARFHPILAYESPGSLRGLVETLAHTRVSNGDVQAHFHKIVGWLTNDTLAADNLRLLTALLRRTVGAAIDRVRPLQSYDPEQRLAWSRRLQEKLDTTASLEDLLNQVHEVVDEEQRNQLVQFLPPLRDLNLSPVHALLSRRPAGECHEIVSLRQTVREFLELLASQADRTPPTVTVHRQSVGILASARHRRGQYQECLTRLRQSSIDDLIEIMDALHHLSDLTRTSISLDPEAATALVDLATALSPTVAQSYPSAIVMIHQLLHQIANESDLPPKVQSYLRWHCR